MYEKLLHGEQAMWWTHAEWYNILEQPAELRRYIRARYQVIATLTSRVTVSTVNRGGSHRDDDTKPKKAQDRPPASQQKRQ
jgi:hypothetical protein